MEFTFKSCRQMRAIFADIAAMTNNIASAEVPDDLKKRLSDAQLLANDILEIFDEPGFTPPDIERGWEVLSAEEIESHLHVILQAQKEVFEKQGQSIAANEQHYESIKKFDGNLEEAIDNYRELVTDNLRRRVYSVIYDLSEACRRVEETSIFSSFITEDFKDFSKELISFKSLLEDAEIKSEDMDADVLGKRLWIIGKRFEDVVANMEQYFGIGHRLEDIEDDPDQMFEGDSIIRHKVLDHFCDRYIIEWHRWQDYSVETAIDFAEGYTAFEPEYQKFRDLSALAKEFLRVANQEDFDRNGRRYQSLVAFDNYIDDLQSDLDNFEEEQTAKSAERLFENLLDIYSAETGRTMTYYRGKLKEIKKTKYDQKLRF